MAERESSTRTLRSIGGGALLAVGSILIVIYLSSLTLQFQPFFSDPLAGILDSCGALGVMLLRALQTIVFDRPLLLSIGSKILVLFSAFTLTLIGVLLRSPTGPRAMRDRLTAPFSAKGDQ